MHTEKKSSAVARGAEPGSSLDQSRETVSRDEISGKVLAAFRSQYDTNDAWQAAFRLARAWKEVVDQEPEFDDLAPIAEAIMQEFTLPTFDAEGLAESAIAVYADVRGADPVRSAFMLALSDPAPMASCGPRLKVLLAYCNNMAEWFPQGFTIPQAKIAELFTAGGRPVSQQVISKMVRRLVDEGYVAVVDSSWSYEAGRGKLYKRLYGLA